MPRLRVAFVSCFLLLTALGATAPTSVNLTRTIAAGTPATFRSSILLLETAGQPATVRVSLWYTFPAGTLVSAQTVSSKEFTVGANQTSCAT